MIRGCFAAALLALSAAAGAAETLGVVAVGDPPAGPDGDLAELAHQLRAACRDRVGGVLDVPTMRARLLGQWSNATLSELDRAYGGALAVYQNGEFDSAVRTLRAIVEDLESLPESDESYAQWIRAQLRLAHAALTIGLERDADGAFFALARTDLSIQADADQYSPPFRRRLEHVKAKVRALVARRLTVTADGAPGTVFVNGRRIGTTPVSVWLPVGKYRIGGAVGTLRVPSLSIDLESEDRSVVLDFALAESLRVNAGPGLALDPVRRGDGIVRAGAWLGADRLVSVSRVFEGEAQFLLGSIYDVRRGALLREGSVRMVAGSVPSANLGALASFLLTGQSSRDVKDRTAEARAAPVASAARPRQKEAAAAAPSPPLRPPTRREEGKAPAVADLSVPPPAAEPAAVSKAALAAPLGPDGERPGIEDPPGADAVSTHSPWMRRGAWASALLAGGVAVLSIQQGLAARNAYADAKAMVAWGDVLLPGADADRYRDLVARGDSATRNAYISAGAAVALAATAGALGWMSRDRPPAALAFRF